MVESLSDDAKLTLMMFVQDKKQRVQPLRNRVQAARDRLQQRQEAFWLQIPEADRGLRSLTAPCEMIEGFAAEAILSEAEKRKWDLIVLGAHGHGMSQTFLAGIIHRARVWRLASIA